MSAARATRAEICVAACADLFAGDGEILASPMGLLPTLGARLAKLTTEPGLLLTDGEAGLLADVSALDGVSGTEGWLPYRKVFDVVASGRRHVVMGANQIDRYGNQNISCIGPHERPDRQLLGVRGAPGNTVNHPTSYWIPRHGTRVFVPRVDVVSGVGYDNATRAGDSARRYHEIRRVVSDLGVFDFGTPDHSMRLVSVHPGVRVEDVLERTSFPLDAAGAGVTRTPDEHELRLLREVLDPGGLREREVAS